MISICSAPLVVAGAQGCCMAASTAPAKAPWTLLPQQQTGLVSEHVVWCKCCMCSSCGHIVLSQQQLVSAPPISDPGPAHHIFTGLSSLVCPQKLTKTSPRQHKTHRRMSTLLSAATLPCFSQRCCTALVAQTGCDQMNRCGAGCRCRCRCLTEAQNCAHKTLIDFLLPTHVCTNACSWRSLLPSTRSWRRQQTV